MNKTDITLNYRDKMFTSGTDPTLKIESFCFQLVVIVFTNFLILKFFPIKKYDVRNQSVHSKLIAKISVIYEPRFGDQLTQPIFKSFCS